jgi:uncharacterized protein (DUF1330 family)
MKLNAQTDPKTDTSPRFQVAMLCWLAPGAEATLAQFRKEASPLWDKYDLRTERVLNCTGKGQVVGENAYEAPQLIQVISLPSAAAFQAYLADPEYVHLAKQRDTAFLRLSAIVGMPMDVTALHPTSTQAATKRLYGIAFLRFQPDGAEGLAEFNRRAGDLFLRHGMHVELMFNVMKTVTPVGEALSDFAPQRVIVFFLDDATALRDYATDPEYIELAPIRDKGLLSYDFFLGKVKA